MLKLPVMLKLQGVFPAITTPFDHNGDVWEIKLRHNVEKWNQTGLAGYVVCGSTGENAYLNAEEKYRMFEWVAEYADPGKLLIAGTGAESVRETVALTNKTVDLGYHAALVLTPHYYRSLMDRADTQMLFYSSVADRAKIPILLYNYPGVTGLDLMTEAVAELSHHPNIIGMKDSSGNVEKLEQMIRAAKPGFQIVTGSASTLAASLAVGAPGGVLAFANAAPYAAISIWEAHRTRETAAAQDWQSRILPASQLVNKCGIAALKYAMDLNGYYGGPPRLPLTVLTPEAKKAVEAVFDGIKG
jgi:4-hydroxy-2-oxoglutarate aldolase